jgi:hypothetical protein
MCDKNVASKETISIWLVAVLAAGISLGFAFAVPSPAAAKPEFAAQTGLPCGKCHTSQAGGGPRTAFGEAFKANGFKLPAKK